MHYARVGVSEAIADAIIVERVWVASGRPSVDLRGVRQVRDRLPSVDIELCPDVHTRFIQLTHSLRLL